MNVEIYLQNSYLWVKNSGGPPNKKMKKLI